MDIIVAVRWFTKPSIVIDVFPFRGNAGQETILPKL